MPMIARSNVVLPAPLRPNTLMISPAATVRSNPRSTVVAPYPARTSRSSSNLPPMPPEIDVENSLIAAELVQSAASEHAALVKPRHRHVDLPTNLHVVLDCNHATALAEFGDQSSGARGLFSRHARGGLVEQDHRRFPGQNHPDLQPLLLTMRQAARRIA